MWCRYGICNNKEHDGLSEKVQSVYTTNTAPKLTLWKLLNYAFIKLYFMIEWEYLIENEYYNIIYCIRMKSNKCNNKLKYFLGDYFCTRKTTSESDNLKITTNHT